MELADYKLPAPEFEKIFRAEVLLDDAWPLGEIGTGYSEIVAVKGGSFKGKIDGTIMDFGGDWGLLYNDIVNAMDTRYLLKTDDGAYISVTSKGRLIMDYQTMERVSTGEAIAPKDYYFRTSIEFTTGADKYKWLNDIVAFAVTMITPEGNICLDAYQLL